MSKSKIKGLLHVHTNLSHDGKNSLKEMVDRLRAYGFNFCIITDHYEDLDYYKYMWLKNEIDKIHREKKDFIIILGVEIPYKNAHVIAFPFKKWIKIDYHKKFSREEVARLRNVADIIILAHPTKFNYLGYLEILPIVDGYEIWNAKADGIHTPNIKFIKFISKHEIFDKKIKYVGMDLHDIKFPLVLYLEVINVETLDSQKIIQLLKEGNFINKSSNHVLRLRGSDSVNNIVITPSIVLRYYIFSITRKFLKILYKPFKRFGFAEKVKLIIKRHI